MVGRFISNGFPDMFEYSIKKKADTQTKMGINQSTTIIQHDTSTKSNIDAMVKNSLQAHYKQVQAGKLWNASPRHPTC
jgi:hypothetical protein